MKPLARPLCFRAGRCSMDRHFVTTLALRLLGLFVLLQALLPLGYMVSEIVQALTSDGLGLERAAGSFLALVLLFGFGLMLMLRAPRIAARWVGREEPAAEAPRLTPHALEVLGYRLLGVCNVQRSSFTLALTEQGPVQPLPNARARAWRR